MHEHGIRFRRAFGQARVEMWHTGNYHIVQYCPWCGERFNIILDKKELPTFKKGDYMMYTGRGISYSVPKSKDTVVIDHISLMDPSKAPEITKAGQEKLKDLADIINKYGINIFKGLANPEPIRKEGYEPKD
jgi:hypothetical protein